MAIDQHIIELMNASIDGEIGAAEKKQLDAVLQGNDDARAMHDELAALARSLDITDTESPPPHLRHVIMNSFKAAPAPRQAPGFWQSLVAAPMLKYSMTFAMGVVLTLSVISSGQIRNGAFDDVTGLVGTVADPVASTLENTVAIDKMDLAGTVSLRSAGTMLILDFDLVANGPVEIKADYAHRNVWFNGFGQLESKGTTISARNGNVTVGMEGRRRYAVYLHNGGEKSVTINLQFIAGGELVHEAELNYKAAH